MAQIRQLVLYEGLLVSGVGVTVGFLMAILFFVLQRQFGIISVPDGFVIDAYPIVLRAMDFLVVGATVVAIGLFASLLPARKGAIISTYVREE